MTSPAATRYAFQATPWDAPLSFGVQAFIEYNGYVLNDRYQSDRIQVSSITGLDDADVSVSSEVIPGDHGEVAYDGFYRGRTFTITGSILGGSLGSLKRLERDLKAAFAPLVESPMKFRWFDVLDQFDTSTALQNYTAAVGSASGLSLGVGSVGYGLSASFVLTRTGESRLWGDNQTTLGFTQGKTGDASTVAVVPKLRDSGNYVSVAYVNGGTLQVIAVIGGTPHVLSSSATGVALQQGQQAWLRAKIERDLVTAELWTAAPTISTLPTASTSALLTGSDADLLGDQVVSSVGFGGAPLTATWSVQSLRIRSLYPGDVAFNARKLSPLSIKDSQDSRTNFKRAFQITMRASSPFALGATQIRSRALVPSATSTPATGFIFPLTFPLRFLRYGPGVTTSAANLLFVDNRGTVSTRPLIYVYGPISSLAILNLTNGQQVIWSGSVADGDYLVLDCAARTLVNSIGANQMQFFSSSDSTWMRLEPGWNDLYLAGSGYGAATKMVVYSRHGWL
jgi:hypothetical protein